MLWLKKTKKNKKSLNELQGITGNPEGGGSHFSAKWSFVWEIHGAMYVTATGELALWKCIKKDSFLFPSVTLCLTTHYMFYILTWISSKSTTYFRHSLYYTVQQHCGESSLIITLVTQMADWRYKEWLNSVSYLKISIKFHKIYVSHNPQFITKHCKRQHQHLSNMINYVCILHKFNSSQCLCL